MTTQTIQSAVEPTNVVRLDDRRPMLADHSVGTIRLPDVPPVEKAADAGGRPSGWARALEVGGRAWGHTTSAARLTALGVGTTIQRVWEYETAGEVTDQIRTLRAERRTADPERRRELDDEIARLRERRHQVAYARHREHATLAGAGVGGAAVVALIVATVMVGLVVPAVSAGIAGGAAYLAGRREQARRDSTVQLGGAGGSGDGGGGGPRRPQLPTGGGDGGDGSDDERPAPVDGVYTPAALGEGAPFPIDRATTVDQAAECILRALLKEGIPVGDVSTVARTDWGWQCIVRVTEGTPAAIIGKAADLETTFDVAQGAVRPQPLVERRARALFRVVESDPFASAPAPEYLAPKSISIRDRRRIGSSIDGDPLLITVAGVMGEAIAASGGGKTGILQAMAEVTTACHDAITIDLDPAGDGLEDLGPATRLQGRTHEQIEHTLLWLLMLGKARARLRRELGMGRKWITTPEHPSIVVFIDEYPALSKLGKKLAFDLLKVGRKEAIPVIIASQGGTTAYLGENIAQALALKIVGPCKKVDTSAVFGDGAAAEGWLPHRLSPATDTDPRDAGHVYAQGIPGMQNAPIEYKIHEHPKGALARLAEERRDAGLLDPDADSLRAMAGVDLPDYVLPEYDAEGNIKKDAPVELLTWERLLRLCEADPPAAEVTPDTPPRAAVRDAIAAMEEQAVDRMRTERLVEVLAARTPEVYRGLTVEILRDLIREGGGGLPVTLGPLDGLANPRGYKLAALRGAL